MIIGSKEFVLKKLTDMCIPSSNEDYHTEIFKGSVAIQVEQSDSPCRLIKYTKGGGVYFVSVDFYVTELVSEDNLNEINEVINLF